MDADTSSTLSPLELERYSTQLCLPEVGVHGQKILKKASVVVIGAGGLGCPVLLYLSAAGIGRIGIVDHDCVSLSNLQRQIMYSVDDIGKLKCQVAKQKCARLNPHVHFEDLNVMLDSNNGRGIIEQYDLVIDATDNFDARYAINDICVSLGKPFVYGSIHGHEGQIAVFNQRVNYRTLFPVPPEPNTVPNCAIGGVIGALAGVVGSIQATEAIKLILQPEMTLSGKLLVINALTWKVRQYQIGPESAPSDSFIINMEKLRQMQKENTNMLFVDVREDTNLPLKFEDAVRIPFSQLVASLKLPKDKCVVLYCNKGIMSTHAAKILRNQYKYHNVFSLV